VDDNIYNSDGEFELQMMGTGYNFNGSNPTYPVIGGAETLILPDPVERNI
jgi:hypothetical protein